ncbi:MAG: DUF2290 domain-containing protein [Symploca sp. SIO3E6]|nr:DUF2290 domain-containing protein [Caldora sp. SIO3E6]
MTPSEIRGEIQKLNLELLNSGLGIDQNIPVIYDLNKDETLVTWASSQNTPNFSAYPIHTVEEYLSFIRARQFSVILFDGSLFQITYGFKGNNIVKHRLCFCPCPFEEVAEMLAEGEALLDVIELFISGEGEKALLQYESSKMRLQSSIRFDYDEKSFTENHPASHLTLSNTECRIPVFAPLSIGHFIQFIFRHFFSKQWEEHSFIRQWPCKRLNRTITPDEEQQQIYLDCRIP